MRVRIVDAERFRDGSGHEAVKLECGHVLLRQTPTMKDTHMDCPGEHLPDPYSVGPKAVAGQAKYIWAK